MTIARGISRLSLTTPIPRLRQDNGRIRISSRASEAAAEHEPVVALESAIITHGMPFPHNIELALAMEARLREKVRTKSISKEKAKPRQE
jgi:pseudouridine-5'-phosphate glycosidase